MVKWKVDLGILFFCGRHALYGMVLSYPKCFFFSFQELEGQSLSASSQFDTFGFTAAEHSRKHAEKEQHERYLSTYLASHALL